MNLVVVVSLLTGLLIYAGLRGGEWFWQDMKRRRMVRLIEWDPDTSHFAIRFVKRLGAAVDIGGGKRLVLDATARAPCNVPTYIVNPRHGFNYVPLADSETVNKDRIIQKLAISNPAMGHNQMVRNKTKDALTANDPEDNSWIMVAILVGGVIVVGLLGVILFFVMKIGDKGGA